MRVGVRMLAHRGDATEARGNVAVLGIGGRAGGRVVVVVVSKLIVVLVLVFGKGPDVAFSAGLVDTTMSVSSVSIA
jgi:hypothetical protein